MSSAGNPPISSSSFHLTSGLDQRDEQSPLINPPRCFEDEGGGKRRRRCVGKQPPKVHSKAVSSTPAKAGGDAVDKQGNEVNAAAANYERVFPLPTGGPSAFGKGRPTVEDQELVRGSEARPEPERRHSTQA